MVGNNMENLYTIRLTETQLGKLEELLDVKVEMVAEGDYEIDDDVPQAEEQAFWQALLDKVDNATDESLELGIV